jgi:hypothetical protein
LPEPPPGERQQPRRRIAEEDEHLAELLLAPDERRRLDRQIRLVERLQRRKLARTQLVDPLRRRHVLQAVLAELDQAVGTHELAGGLGDEHLPAVPDRGDARGAMDVEPDVPLVGDDRLAGVDAHTHADGPRRQRLLPHPGGGQRVTCARERHEERVALRVDLDPVVRGERCPEHAPVLPQRVRVAVTQLVQQLRRAFDVGEEEGDGAAGKLAHRAMIAG